MLKKKKYIFILVGVILALSILGTLAWWRWSSDINALIYGEGCAPEISFAGGNIINATNMVPVQSYTEGLKKDIIVNLQERCEDDTALVDIKLRLDIFPSSLADPSFKWALYQGNNYINDGDFDNQTQYVQGQSGGIITLTDTPLEVSTGSTTYSLYIYIDGNMDNDYTMGDQFFKFSLFGEGIKAIYKENQVSSNLVMTSSSTHFFLADYDELLKDNIGSIEILPFNEIDSNYTELPDTNNTLSSDDSIKIYYQTNSETGKNDVVIGTSNGILKMNTNMDYMFAGLKYVESLDLTHLDTSDVTSMIGCFYNSTGLTTLDVSSWDTSKVTAMNNSNDGGGMFQKCSNLEALDLSNFDISNLVSLGYMFSGCTKLKSINLSGFDTSNVSEMYNMFKGCSSLEELDLSSFRTPKLTMMFSMFNGCSSLKKLDLSSFDTSKVTGMQSLFQGCSNLEELDISSFRTVKVKNMQNMFNGCKKLKELDLSLFNTSIVEKMSGMFSDCWALTTLNLSSFSTEKCNTMLQMFSNCRSLEELDLSNFDTSLVTTMKEMFYNCEKLERLNISNFVSTKVTTIQSMFLDCGELEYINMEDFDLSKELNITSTFLSIPTTAEIIVNNCTDFNNKFSSYNFTNVHLANNTSCTA